MMEKKQPVQIYLGKEGITSTSANYVANIAKEMIRREQSDLDNVDFVNEKMMMANSEIVHETKRGDDEALLMSLPEKVERIAKMKSLIGWLREGIKAKDALIKEVEEKSFDDVVELLGLEKLEHMVYSGYYREDEFLKTLPAEVQTKWHILNTKAAIYGKFINEKGALGKARKDVLDCKHAASAVEKTVGLFAIVERTPSVEMEKIDAVYFDLQDKYREVQKELNSILYKAKEEMHVANLAMMNEQERFAAERRHTLNSYNERVEKWRKVEAKRIADLKIVIPQELRDIYDEVNSK